MAVQSKYFASPVVLWCMACLQHAESVLRQLRRSILDAARQFPEKYPVFILDRSLDCKTGNDIFISHSSTKRNQFRSAARMSFCATAIAFRKMAVTVTFEPSSLSRSFRLFAQVTSMSRTRNKVPRPALSWSKDQPRFCDRAAFFRRYVKL